jgi:hypothetical protein
MLWREDETKTPNKLAEVEWAAPIAYADRCSVRCRDRGLSILLLSHYLAPYFETLLIEPDRHSVPQDDEVIGLSFADETLADGTQPCSLADITDDL